MQQLFLSTNRSDVGFQKEGACGRSGTRKPSLPARTGHVNTANHTECAHLRYVFRSSLLADSDIIGDKRSANPIQLRERARKTLHAYRRLATTQLPPDRAPAGRRSTTLERGTALGLPQLTRANQEIRGCEITRRVRRDAGRPRDR